MNKLLLVLLCVVALMFSACSMDEVRDAIDSITTDNGGSSSGSSGSEDKYADYEYAYEADAEKLAADLTLYNGYLGVSYTIPGGWWIYEVNYDNFDESAGATTDPGTLDIIYGDSNSYISMASFGSLQYSERDNHIGIDISADLVEGAETIDDYMADYIDFILEPYDGITYELLEESDATLQGKDFYQCIFLVNQEERPYNVLTMTCEVNDGYFLTLTGNYWPENKKAVENIIQYMDNGLRFL